MSNDEGEDTPLKRYLAKKKADDALSGAGGGVGAGGVGSSAGGAVGAGGVGSSSAEDPGVELGAPAYPPTGEVVREVVPEVVGEPAPPAGFWARLIAYAIDVAIVWMISYPVGFVLNMMFSVVTLGAGGWNTLGTLSELLVTFFYFGWFYTEKGGTPGKMVFDLEVENSVTGRRLSYWHTFLRETIGKLVSGLILCLGFLIAAFRTDKRALHDMIFDTRVVVRP